MFSQKIEEGLFSLDQSILLDPAGIPKFLDKDIPHSPQLFGLLLFLSELLAHFVVLVQGDNVPFVDF